MSRYNVFDSLIDTVLVVDAESRLHYGNTAAATLFDVSTRRLTVGRDLAQFCSFTPDPIGSREELLGVNEPTQMKEVAYKMADGREGWVQVSVQRAPEYFIENSEEGERWIVFIHDVSLEKVLHVKYRGELDQKEVVINDLKAARAKLEEYSQTLEKKVEERTVELREANLLLKTILDSLGQGILVFDKDGKCLPVYSAITQKLLEGEPAGKQIEDLMGLIGEDRENYEKWREIVFEGLLDFEDLVPLAPARLQKRRGLEVEMTYNPLHDSKGQLAGVVTVATDRTQELAALRKAERERELVNKVTQVARNKDAFRLFVIEARRLLSELTNTTELNREEVGRRLHTLKGGAASFGLTEAAKACHRLEDDLASGGAGFVERLSKESAAVLVLLERELSGLAELLGPIALGAEAQSYEISAKTLRNWVDTLKQLTTVDEARGVGQLIHREFSEKPVDAAIRHLGPSLTDLASTQGKKLSSFAIKGGSTRIPWGYAQPLLASLIHAFRNSVHHGLETPSERAAIGKPEGGTISIAFDRTLSAANDRLSIVIEDDGRGVNPERIRQKLREKGLNSVAEGTDQEVIQAILRDDFSTAESVDLVAGRGIGMAAIADEVRKLGGTISVRSVVGQGMALEIDVPVVIPPAAAKLRAA